MDKIKISNTDIKETLVYLDELRESGVTNMYGAAQYIEEDCNFPRAKARQLLLLWMKSFSDAPMSSRVKKALEFYKETK